MGATITMCQIDLYAWYNYPQRAYSHDVFMPFKDLYQYTSKYVTTERVQDLNIDAQNLATKVVGFSILVKTKVIENFPYMDVTPECLGQ